MLEFIEVIDSSNKRHLINTRHIEEVVECDENKCYIYLMHNSPGAIEQDCYLINEPYEVIKTMIRHILNRITK